MRATGRTRAKRRERPDADWHRARLREVADLDACLSGLIAEKLSGRTSAPVVDAALALDHTLWRLSEALLVAAADGALIIGSSDGAVRERRLRGVGRLSPDEHRALGRALYDLRDRFMVLDDALTQHFCKSSRVGRAKARLQRGVDRLRCRLDGLFARQHPREFNTRVYYPGAAAWRGVPRDA